MKNMKKIKKFQLKIVNFTAVKYRLYDARACFRNDREDCTPCNSLHWSRFLMHMNGMETPHSCWRGEHNFIMN